MQIFTSRIFWYLKVEKAISLSEFYLRNKIYFYVTIPFVIASLLNMSNKLLQMTFDKSCWIFVLYYEHIHCKSKPFSSSQMKSSRNQNAELKLQMSSLHSIRITVNYLYALQTIPHQQNVWHNFTQQHQMLAPYYLSGWQVFTGFKSVSSLTKNFPNGVPHGFVLNLTLFNLPMHSIPNPPNNICISTIMTTYMRFQQLFWLLMSHLCHEYSNHPVPLTSYHLCWDKFYYVISPLTPKYIHK